MDVFQQLEDVTNEFLVIKRYPEATLTEPLSDGKWSIREIVGHLLYWDMFNIEKMIPYMSNGATLPAFPNHDLHNAEAVEYLQTYRNVGDILDDFIKTRKQFINELKKLDTNIKFHIQNEPNTFTPETFVAIFLEHDIHHVNQVKEKLKNKTFKVERIEGYSPQMGHLVSMMNYARYTTLQAVQGLTTEQIDVVPNQDRNSIGALLFHMAAVEFGFQVEFFDKRRPNEKESEEWGAAYLLGEAGRSQIKGYPLSFYLEKLEQVRNRTLEELKKRNDEWLYEEVLWDNQLSNHYFIWFHTFEDEINHRGQIRIIRKTLG